jgi:hypothetical protein
MKEKENTLKKQLDDAYLRLSDVRSENDSLKTENQRLLKNINVLELKSKDEEVKVVQGEENRILEDIYKRESKRLTVEIFGNVLGSILFS